MYTFDIEDVRTTAVMRAWIDSVHFVLADLESYPLNVEVISAVEQSDFLFIDGGDKIVEAKLYAPFVKVGAGMMLHDYNYNHLEMAPFQELVDLGFVQMYSEVAATFNSCARFWMRVGRSSQEVSETPVETNSGKTEL